MAHALELVDLVMHHPTPAGLLRAVDGVDFAVETGETLGLVGESGCGKSTLARCVVGLNTPTRGVVRLGGKVAGTARAERLERAKRVQMVFQDPMSALNPRLTIRQIIEQPLKVHGEGTPADRRKRVEMLMRQVGLGEHHLEHFPHELSGGQRQRVSIARALTLEPDLIVCDEAVSALDVSVQAQVLNLLTDLQKRLGVAFLFISHDLAVIRYISNRIAVMYLGRIVEIGDSESVWQNAQHPYTRALIASIPDERAKRGVSLLTGDVPSPVNPPSGCAFRTRCPLSQPVCAEARPELSAAGRLHSVACHFAG
ncbi:oligopeptide/dipeptide ABC transporter ATP-binding protein [Mesorhizobium sp. YR577]|uniref:ABC transporter ATP-binding protein n=1 Tax=Mesorhizobium sp. YR577 TaxID=1884373 RepID=UPI0008E919D6|nr:oligopeptide/dipeptide ABC transporter ATP-binding protein [Mesorhizobium sp. YR577]SFU22398.1 peptide/nickel transport system ATP-binding protein [Mesorhizobium sp. YR577]